MTTEPTMALHLLLAVTDFLAELIAAIRFGAMLCGVA